MTIKRTLSVILHLVEIEGQTSIIDDSQKQTIERFNVPHKILGSTQAFVTEGDTVQEPVTEPVKAKKGFV